MKLDVKRETQENKTHKAILLLEDGTVFFGKSIKGEGTSFGEICFNTGMTGYQEIFTDPSYFGQIVVMSNVHIGNYGVHSEESESNSIKIAGLVCRNFSDTYSRNNDACDSLNNFLNNDNIFGIRGVDTRTLVSHIRDNGAMNAVISTNTEELVSLKEQLSKIPSMEGLELVSKVSTKKPYLYGDEKATYRLVVIDMGVKMNMLRLFAQRDVYIKVFPYNTSFEETQQWNPDGYFISNGPGDPDPLKDTIDLVREINKHKMPLFGICLGHQIIALANGIKTYKMYNGHRGINHPVLNKQTNQGEITSQNHGFAIDKEQTDANTDVTITHQHLNDDTVAGIEVVGHNCFSVQYHPEASPGPNDVLYLFDKFIDLIKKHKK